MSIPICTQISLVRVTGPSVGRRKAVRIARAKAGAQARFEHLRGKCGRKEGSYCPFRKPRNRNFPPRCRCV